jgi:hypothetical protein
LGYALDVVWVIARGIGLFAAGLFISCVPIVIWGRRRKSRVAQSEFAAITEAEPGVHSWGKDGHWEPIASDRPVRKTGSRKGLLFMAAMLIAGLYLLTSGPVDVLISHWHYAQWPKVTGTVVDVVTKRGHLDSYPGGRRRYRFQLHGSDYQADGPTMGDSPWGKDLSVGQEVMLAYNPSNPEQVLSKQDTQIYPNPVGSVLIGGLASVIGGYGVVACWPRRTARRR